MAKFYFLSLFTFLTLSVGAQEVVGTWQLAQQAGALGVGPTMGSTEWWSNSTDDLAVRDCLFDDLFVFSDDGTFMNEQQGETWLEKWQGVVEDECGDPVAPHDGSNAATWEFDADNGTITLKGVGAHLGLPKVINGAEISDPAAAPDQIVYPVTFSQEDRVMTIDISFGGGFWRFVLEKQETSSDRNTLAAQTEISVYPNPASTELQVTSSDDVDYIVLRTLDGKEVGSNYNPFRTETLDVSQLPRGMYLLEVGANDTRTVHKVVLAN